MTFVTHSIKKIRKFQKKNYEFQILDEVDEGLVLEGCVNSRSPFITKNGGGESMLSLTDFEVTTMTPLADIEDDNEEFEDYGCGEAPILSTSNSLMASSDPSSVSDSGGEVKNITKEVVQSSDTKDQEEGLFRTFLPKNSRSLSRDFLNETPKRGWRRMGGSSRKRASAVELNGEDYLVFERGFELESSRDDSINPLAYRGGTAKVIGMV